MPTRREEAITARVIAAREKAGLDRKDLAEALSLDQNSYGHYERGRYAFTVDQLFTLSRTLNRPVEWFLGLETGLSEDEEELVFHWRRISVPEIKEALLNMVKAAPKG